MQESGVYGNQWEECMAHVVRVVLRVKPAKSARVSVLTVISLCLCCMFMKTYLEQVPNRTKIQRTKVSVLVLRAVSFALHFVVLLAAWMYVRMQSVRYVSLCVCSCLT